MAAYVDSKKADPVQQAYEETPEGGDAHSDSYQGDFYLIRQGIEKVNGVRESAQEVSVYVNDFSLYFARLRAENRPTGYRDVLGSVSFKKQLVHENEEDIIVEQGLCCQSLSKIELFEVPSFAQKQLQNKQLEARFRNLVEEQFTEATMFKWKQMTCFVVKVKGNSHQDLALCSPVADRVQRLRMAISNNIIRLVMAEKGITDYTIMEETSRERTMGQNKEYDAFRNWSFESWQKWPKECKGEYKNKDRLRSPIILQDRLIEALINEKVIPNFKKTDNKEEQDEGIVLDKSGMVVQKDAPFSFINQEDRSSYFRHPTFTYRGNHENFIVGLLGEMTLTLNSKERQNEKNKKGPFKQVSKNRYYGFAMKFKLPGEHRFEQTTYNAEVHVHLMQRKDYSSFNDMMGEMFNLDKSLAYRQFANGFNKDDGLEMDYLLDKMTDLVLVIPLTVDLTMTAPNMFLHYLNHEDWFEAAALEPEEVSQLDNDDKLKINNKDLEMPTIQDSKDKNKEMGKQQGKNPGKWELACFPGSLRCLYDQIKQQESMYFYKGTITTPPCTKEVDYVLMKNPIKIRPDDFNSLRKNVFAFRQATENINKYLTSTNYKQYKNMQIVRSMDYSEVNCAESKEMKKFMSNSMLLDPIQQEKDRMTLESLSNEDSGNVAMQDMIQKQQLIQQIQKSGKIEKSITIQEITTYFSESPERYYRRLIAQHKLAHTIEELRELATDALES